MRNFKFKEGDLVEILKSNHGNEGHRFVVKNFGIKGIVRDDGSIVAHNCKFYEADISRKTAATKNTWAREHHLKLVNPDIDNISESTFSEIMDEMTETVKVEK